MSDGDDGSPDYDSADAVRWMWDMGQEIYRPCSHVSITVIYGSQTLWVENALGRLIFSGDFTWDALYEWMERACTDCAEERAATATQS